jgi:hypothetical protein
MCLPSTSLQELINDVRAQQRSRKVREPSTATIVTTLLSTIRPSTSNKRPFRDSSPSCGLVGVLSRPRSVHTLCSEQCRLCSSSRRNRWILYQPTMSSFRIFVTCYSTMSFLGSFLSDFEDGSQVTALNVETSVINLPIW